MHLQIGTFCAECSVLKPKKVFNRYEIVPIHLEDHHCTIIVQKRFFGLYTTAVLSLNAFG